MIFEDSTISSAVVCSRIRSVTHALTLNLTDGRPGLPTSKHMTFWLRGWQPLGAALFYIFRRGPACRRAKLARCARRSPAVFTGARLVVLLDRRLTQTSLPCRIALLCWRSLGVQIRSSSSISGVVLPGGVVLINNCYYVGVLSGTYLNRRSFDTADAVLELLSIVILLYRE